MKKSITKRFRVTKNGKVMRRSMGVGHNGTRKNANQKRRIRNGGALHDSDTQLIHQALHRSLNLRKAVRPNKVN